MVRQATTSSSRYRVRALGDGWSLDWEGLQLGLFREAPPAVAEACRLAKADAQCGTVGIVTVHTEPQELHCFTPTLGGSADYPRLVVSNDRTAPAHRQ